MSSIFLKNSVRITLLFVSAFFFWVFQQPVYGYSQAYYQSYYQGYYQGTYYQYQYQYEYQYPTPGFTINPTTQIKGNLSVTGSLSKGSGTFVIDHPLDPENKLLYHSFVESPDVKNIYDGIAVLGDSGEVVIELPEYFEALNKDFRYQTKPITAPAPSLYIKEEIQNNRFTIAGGDPGTKISWQVTGIRKDPYILANPIDVEVEKGPDALVDKGEYLFPEQTLSYRFKTLFAGALSYVRNLFGSTETASQ